MDPKTADGMNARRPGLTLTETLLVDLWEAVEDLVDDGTAREIAEQVGWAALIGSCAGLREKSDLHGAIRVCPKRDAACPHGMACPYWLDRYECREEA